MVIAFCRFTALAVKLYQLSGINLSLRRKPESRRKGLNLFLWIPAYAGMTDILSVKAVAK